MTLYGDVQIYECDLETLKPSQWINDIIIQFYYEYLTKELLKDESVLFLPPSLSHLITNVPDVLRVTSALPTGLPKKRLVFIPINDSTSFEYSGSHWSLLIFFRDTSTYYYYDSLGSSNMYQAKTCMKKIHAVLSPLNPSRHFAVVETPRQINSFDCGVYVMAISRIIAERFVKRVDCLTDKPGDLAVWRLSSVITPEYVTKLRSDVHDLILKLAR